ncbi:hypothetical protein K438DRAFT_1872520 [Mycena galopus ATCC 62051]|nr:hypothetical protein K438DRAFT_1872520 [Mycena galopus ATCC 62051]
MVGGGLCIAAFSMGYVYATKISSVTASAKGTTEYLREEEEGHLLFVSARRHIASCARRGCAAETGCEGCRRCLSRYAQRPQVRWGRARRGGLGGGRWQLGCQQPQ